ncbi:hypothetical protein [Pseudoruegeria sp. SK021]|uniref:hypothetical protein n=1 Tax=Pseudoruegeria sp. SK021 TaxID=1933035 RepID=UPI000A22670C|nr:hypothetical protein [Pseudoruegeria sp. SK021]OSP56696.1 hypothetical protein BV911_01730 [Pseudoruegeria sp. SK021]
MTEPFKSFRIPILAVLATLGSALAVTAQGQGPDSPWRRGVNAGAATYLERDLDGGGSFSNTRGVVSFNVTHGTSFRESVGVSLSLGHSAYDFSDTIAPWGDINDYALSVPITFGLSDQVTALVVPSLRFDGEDGVDFDDGQTGALILGAAWRIRDGLTLGPGLGMQSTLDDDVTLFPFLLIDWAITDRVNLSTGRGLGASRGPGLTLSYAVSDALSLGIAGRYEDVEFRLDEDGVVPGGIGRDRATPVVATLGWQPSRAVSVNAFAGMAFGGSLQVKDSNGRTIDSRDYDPTPLFGGSVDFSF